MILDHGLTPIFKAFGGKFKDPSIKSLFQKFNEQKKVKKTPTSQNLENFGLNSNEKLVYDKSKPINKVLGFTKTIDGRKVMIVA